ncbi:MAG: hypothetical protein L3J32_12300 [Rhizobiaceae bacterium]|nr:hypothetical protein [Rhizobiaceae bacterium]
MKTSLIFLGGLSLVFAGVQNFNGSSPATVEPASISFANINAEKVAWKLSISNASNECIASLVSDATKTIEINSDTNCATALPGLDKIATIRTDSNGDITLYSKDGSKLAQFIESESSVHESIWPQYPLMTLARIN